MQKVKIAIVGHGFVGKAVEYGFNNPFVDLQIIDPKYGTSAGDIREAEYVFVCVPTPMGADGKIDSKILEEVVQTLKNNVGVGTIIIKSTVLPNVLIRLSFDTETIVYNPEFLTEKNNMHDFVNPIMHVFGGYPEKTKEVEELYQNYSCCKPCPVHHMSIIEASFVKYGMNSFLATKVLWFNQYYELVNKFGANYNKIINAIGTDDRIGSSHTNVPGFDGKMGFGGACFTKDTAALLGFARGELSVLEEVVEKNNEIRSQYELDEREKEQHVSYGNKS